MERMIGKIEEGGKSGGESMDSWEEGGESEGEDKKGWIVLGGV